MGAGVIWHGAAIPHRSKRVGGQHSSTRAELAAVVMALHGTPHADDLAILIDSAAAIQRLQWFQGRDFWPTFLTHSANANNLKVSNHSTRSSKLKLDELPSEKYTRYTVATIWIKQNYYSYTEKLLFWYIAFH